MYTDKILTAKDWSKTKTKISRVTCYALFIREKIFQDNIIVEQKLSDRNNRRKKEL